MGIHGPVQPTEQRGHADIHRAACEDHVVAELVQASAEHGIERAVHVKAEGKEHPELLAESVVAETSGGAYQEQKAERMEEPLDVTALRETP